MLYVTTLLIPSSRNRLYLGRTHVTSFRVHFEKRGRGLLREGKRREGEWAVWAKGGGINRKYRSCKIKAAVFTLILEARLACHTAQQSDAT